MVKIHKFSLEEPRQLQDIWMDFLQMFWHQSMKQELLPKKQLNLSKTRIRKNGPKNQLILDKELENQFE